jgi:hypothetical protein
MSIFSNIGAGQLEQRTTDLPALLQSEPRPVLDLILKTIKGSGRTADQSGCPPAR